MQRTFNHELWKVTKHPQNFPFMVFIWPSYRANGSIKYTECEMKPCFLTSFFNAFSLHFLSVVRLNLKGGWPPIWSKKKQEFESSGIQEWVLMEQSSCEWGPASLLHTPGAPTEANIHQTFLKRVATGANISLANDYEDKNIGKSKRSHTERKIHSPRHHKIAGGRTEIKLYTNLNARNCDFNLTVNTIVCMPYITQ